MGLLDKAKALLGQHEEKIEGAIDKVAEVVDDKTGGKHTDKIEKGVEAAKDFVDGDGENVAVGDDGGETPPVPPAVP
jgi:hypothetical protein